MIKASFHWRKNSRLKLTGKRKNYWEWMREKKRKQREDKYSEDDELKWWMKTPKLLPLLIQLPSANHESNNFHLYIEIGEHNYDNQWLAKTSQAKQFVWP